MLYTYECPAPLPGWAAGLRGVDTRGGPLPSSPKAFISVHAKIPPTVTYVRVGSDVHCGGEDRGPHVEDGRGTASNLTHGV